MMRRTIIDADMLEEFGEYMTNLFTFYMLSEKETNTEHNHTLKIEGGLENKLIKSYMSQEILMD